MTNLKNKLILFAALFFLTSCLSLDNGISEVSVEDFNQIVLDFAIRLEEQENGHKHQVELKKFKTGL